MVWYGSLRSYVVADLTNFLGGNVVLRVTRNVRIFPGIFELPAVAAEVMHNNLSQLTALFRTPGHPHPGAEADQDGPPWAPKGPPKLAKRRGRGAQAPPPMLAGPAQ